MTVPTSILTEAQARERLAELGVTADELRDSARIGYNHAAGCTTHDPKSLPGLMTWGKGTGHLRDLLKLRGWRADSGSNYETAVDPTERYAIALASGTSDTGRFDLVPRTRTPKGPATSRAVTRNRQLSFQNDPAFEGLEESGEVETWLLLHRYNIETQEIRLELSCPDEMTGKQVTGWSERIVQSVPFSTELEIPLEDEDEIDIDVDVSRRAN